MPVSGKTSIAKLGHGGNVNSEVLLKICGALNCDVGDIMEVMREDHNEGWRKAINECAW